MKSDSVHDLDARAAQWRRFWDLPDAIAYLNHGSVGLSPRPVLDARAEWIRRIDAQRLGFFRREADAALADARERLGRFIGTSGDNLLFLPNATMAMASVAESFPLGPGDEVLTNDHEYWSVLEIWQRACQEAGARLVVKKLPVPVRDRAALADEFLSAVTPKTRLIVFSHITSRTSFIMPAEELCRKARELEIPVCIDGAHALVQIPVDIDRLDCDFYAASCHKWLCAPTGTGFLYVHPRSRPVMKPLTGARAHDWSDAAFIGTQDISAYLTVPVAIDFIESAGLDSFRKRSHALAKYAMERISALTGLDPWFPDSHLWYASMVALPLPPVEKLKLQGELWEKFKIESYIDSWNETSLVRVSCHLYTQAAEIDRLVDALRELAVK